MIIAVTHKDGKVYEHFGKTEQFKIYNIENNMLSQKIVDIDFSGHTEMVEYLKEIKAEVLICGDIGLPAFKMLEESGISVYAGYSDFADVCVMAYLKKELYKATEPTCKDDGCDCDGDCKDCSSGGQCIH